MYSVRLSSHCVCVVQEEQAKRAARAKKFGLPEERQAPLQYAPDPEDLKRAARAKKFGSTFEPPSAETLLQKAGALAAAATAAVLGRLHVMMPPAHVCRCQRTTQPDSMCAVSACDIRENELPGHTLRRLPSNGLI
jgi:hypothetical protein